MSSTLRIAEVADRAGITTATVRYYERIGVLPPAPRAGNGYRSYDEHTVERLAFINRAKQLGCSLEEIADLRTAWDGGQCGPIQDRLRALVADKLTTAQAEIIELVTLTAELRRTAAALEQHRPVGACDDQCGCVSEPAEATPGEFAVALTAKPAAEPGTTAACTLSPDRMRDRIDTWNQLLQDKTALLGAVTARTAIEDGVRLDFAPGVAITELAQLAAAEQDCCRFFNFAITIDHRGVGLEITAPPDAHAALIALFGAPDDR
ncbi:MAG: MerR family transcriptional regulator [Thermoleophilia bacterium]|nr:MerR family transcriptional regulator [Thermoleophilia bacterium]MCB0965954.1 MerR family transcriptional regulator [Ilumatobacter sp.]